MPTAPVMPNTPTTIDVSGLTSEAIKSVEAFVKMLREPKVNGSAKVTSSIFELFGTAPVLRSADDINRQIQEERDTWGEA